MKRFSVISSLNTILDKINNKMSSYSRVEQLLLAIIFILASIALSLVIGIAMMLSVDDEFIIFGSNDDVSSLDSGVEMLEDSVARQLIEKYGGDVRFVDPFAADTSCTKWIYTPDELAIFCQDDLDHGHELWRYNKEFAYEVNSIPIPNIKDVVINDQQLHV